MHSRQGVGKEMRLYFKRSGETKEGARGLLNENLVQTVKGKERHWFRGR